MPISQPAIKNFGKKDTEVELKRELWQQKPPKNKHKHEDFMNRVKNAKRMLPNRSYTTVDDYEPKGLALTYKNLEANIERYQRSKIQGQQSSDDFEPTLADKNDLMFTTEVDTALPPRAASTLEKPVAF